MVIICHNYYCIHRTMARGAWLMMIINKAAAGRPEVCWGERDALMNRSKSSSDVVRCDETTKRNVHFFHWVLCNTFYHLFKKKLHCILSSILFIFKTYHRHFYARFGRCHRNCARYAACSCASRGTQMHFGGKTAVNANDVMREGAVMMNMKLAAPPADANVEVTLRWAKG